MTTLLKQKKPKNADETFFLKQLQFKIHKVGKAELIDFSSASLLQVRDGNTLYNDTFVRRGLPIL
jgi:hypothetical protein